MRLRFSPQAYADIANIHPYIGHHSPRASTAVAAEIRTASVLLAVYHKVERGELVVIHVRHGRRNAPTTDELHGD